MKIALGQINIQPGQCEQNFLACKAMINQAKKDQADLVVFPEMCISGYFIGDKWLDRDWIKTVESYNEQLKQLADGIGIIWGSVASNILGESFTHHDGRLAIFNCAFFAHNQSWVTRLDGFLGPYIKQLLPTYRMFDDHRYFMDGETYHRLTKTENSFLPYVFDSNNKQVHIGLQVCEDLWDDHYLIKPTQKYNQHQIDLIINVSNSPWTLNKEQSRINQVKKHASYNQATMVFVNASGAQNNDKNVILFDGGSFISKANGDVLTNCNDAFESEYLVVDLDQHATPKTFTTQKLLKGLIKGIQAFDQQMFHQSTPWIVGLSGGIDSSVNAALLVLALGKKKVIGYNLPSKYNQAKTIDNAKRIGEALDIPVAFVDIEKLVSATTDTFNALDFDINKQSNLIENVQARIRGHLLSSFAAYHQGVIINNGNKVETALGYCTLYGDTIGALSPLGDCSKMQIFDLANQINDYFKKEVIPVNLIPTIRDHMLNFDIYPSAELKDNQVDPMKWGYHDWLVNQIVEYPTYQIDKLITSYMDKTIWQQEVGMWLKAYGLDNPQAFLDDLLWVMKQLEISVFKRIQMPPNILVSRGAFGQDYKESQGQFQKSQLFETFQMWVKKQT